MKQEHIAVRQSLPIRVVIPAYKEGKTLQLCINRIVQELYDFPEAEICIVSYKSQVSFPLHEKVNLIQLSKPLNAGQARNLGAANCGNAMLLFIDADVLAEPGSVKKLIQPIADHKADATVGNYSRDFEGYNFFQNYKKLYIHDAYSHKGFIENEFWTAFSAIRGEAFHQAGGFPEHFKLKGGEDTEFGMRLTKLDKKIFAVADACGKHLKHYDLFSLIKNDFDKGTRTVMLNLKQKINLSQNRHAKKSDQMAVFFACLFGVVLLLSCIHPLFLVATPAILSAYFFSRDKFLVSCAQFGLWFYIRSFAMGILLDVVRAFSLINGILKYQTNRMFPGNVPEIQPATPQPQASTV